MWPWLTGTWACSFVCDLRFIGYLPFKIVIFNCYTLNKLTPVKRLARGQPSERQGNEKEKHPNVEQELAGRRSENPAFQRNTSFTSAATAIRDSKTRVEIGVAQLCLSLCDRSHTGPMLHTLPKPFTHPKPNQPTKQKNLEVSLLIPKLTSTEKAQLGCRVKMKVKRWEMLKWFSEMAEKAVRG